MQQIITLQIDTNNTTPVNEYNWRELLKLNESESVSILEYWTIRGTISPDCPPPKECNKQCSNKCKKDSCHKKLPPFHGESNS